MSGGHQLIIIVPIVRELPTRFENVVGLANNDDVLISCAIFTSRIYLQYHCTVQTGIVVHRELYNQQIVVNGNNPATRNSPSLKNRALTFLAT